MRIFVDGVRSSFVLDICENFQVSNVKRAVQSREGICVVDQRILFCGKELSDENELTECGVHSGHRLVVLARLRGGAPTINELWSSTPDITKFFAYLIGFCTIAPSFGFVALKWLYLHNPRQGEFFF